MSGLTFTKKQSEKELRAELQQYRTLNKYLNNQLDQSHEVIQKYKHENCLLRTEVQRLKRASRSSSNVSMSAATKRLTIKIGELRGPSRIQLSTPRREASMSGSSSMGLSPYVQDSDNNRNIQSSEWEDCDACISPEVGPEPLPSPLHMCEKRDYSEYLSQSFVSRHDLDASSSSDDGDEISYMSDNSVLLLDMRTEGPSTPLSPVLSQEGSNLFALNPHIYSKLSGNQITDCDCVVKSPVMAVL